jgi:hypothetical protein
MPLTSEQRDALLVAIAAKVCPEALDFKTAKQAMPVNATDRLERKKPFPEAIGYAQGMAIIEQAGETMSLRTFSQQVCVMGSQLQRVNYSLGYPPTNINELPKAQVRNVWVTYCAKRGW